MKKNNIDLNGLDITHKKYEEFNLKEKETNYECYYRDEVKGCKIHMFKPIFCLSWPFILNLNTFFDTFKLHYNCKNIKNNTINILASNNKFSLIYLIKEIEHLVLKYRSIEAK